MRARDGDGSKEKLSSRLSRPDTHMNSLKLAAGARQRVHRLTERKSQHRERRVDTQSLNQAAIGN